MSAPDGPLISVVTPFHDTEAFLAECIQSVLGQTYRNFEYVLVDNASADRSYDIAARLMDGRCRLIRTDRFLSQVQNYNFALTQMAPASRYCKMVLADDWIYPECLEKMAQIAEAAPTAAVVGAFTLDGVEVKGSGLPYTRTLFSGREICRLQLLEGRFLFGSPTSLMFRASVVRDRTPFFEEGRLHEDTEVCYELLKTADFGFVHHVLTFLRSGNEGISSRVRTFNPHLLDKLIVLERYGRDYLSTDELAAVTAKVRGRYMRYLGEAVLRRPGSEFWRYHEEGLASVGEKLPKLPLALQVARAAAGVALHPGRILRRLTTQRPS